MKAPNQMSNQELIDALDAQKSTVGFDVLCEALIRLLSLINPDQPK